jgi:hypothetical protein
MVLCLRCRILQALNVGLMSLNCRFMYGSGACLRARDARGRFLDSGPHLNGWNRLMAFHSSSSVSMRLRATCDVTLGHGNRFPRGVTNDELSLDPADLIGETVSLPDFWLLLCSAALSLSCRV